MNLLNLPQILQKKYPTINFGLDGNCSISYFDGQYTIDHWNEGSIGVPVPDFVPWLQLGLTENHEWDEKAKTWVLNAAKKIQSETNTLAEAKGRAIAASVEYADSLQATILGDTSPTAQARLVNKYAAAVAIKAGTASDGDHAVIDAEVSLRPKYTKAQLIDVVIAKGTMAKQAEGMINGMLLLAQDAIEAATTLAALDASTKAIMTKANALKTQLLAGLQED